MKVTITQTYEMEIDNNGYKDKSLDDLVNDLKVLYDYKGASMINGCDYQHTIVTEIDGEDVYDYNNNGVVSKSEGYPIFLGKQYE